MPIRSAGHLRCERSKELCRRRITLGSLEKLRQLNLWKNRVCKQKVTTTWSVHGTNHRRDHNSVTYVSFQCGCGRRTQPMADQRCLQDRLEIQLDLVQLVRQDLLTKTASDNENIEHAQDNAGCWLMWRVTNRHPAYLLGLQTRWRQSTGNL